MRDVVYHQLDRFATWPVFGLLIVLFVLCYLGFQWRAKTLNNLAGQEITTFDGRYAYTPEEARALLEMMGERGRRFYAITEVTLDLVFPSIYGSLLLIAIFRLYGGDPGYLLLVPLIASVADLLENFTNTYLALSYKGVASPLAKFSSFCTGVKRSGITISVILVCVGIVVWIRHCRRTTS